MSILDSHTNSTKSLEKLDALKGRAVTVESPGTGNKANVNSELAPQCFDSPLIVDMIAPLLTTEPKDFDAVQRQTRDNWDKTIAHDYGPDCSISMLAHIKQQRPWVDPKAIVRNVLYDPTLWTAQIQQALELGPQFCVQRHSSQRGDNEAAFAANTAEPSTDSSSGPKRRGGAPLMKTQPLPGGPLGNQWGIDYPTILIILNAIRAGTSTFAVIQIPRVLTAVSAQLVLHHVEILNYQAVQGSHSPGYV